MLKPFRVRGEERRPVDFYFILKCFLLVEEGGYLFVMFFGLVFSGLMFLDRHSSG
jgi:hypothetical protein